MLNTHTHYSLRYGILSPEELLKFLSEQGFTTVALTDVNNTSCCLDFVRMAPKYGIKPVLGIDFRNGAAQQYIGIAKNNKGFRELNEHLSRHLHEKKSFDDRAPQFENAFVIYPWTKLAEKGSQLYKSSLLPHEFVGLHPTEINRFKFNNSGIFPEKIVALPTASFRNKRDFNTHRLLRAIDNNTLLSKLDKSQEARPEDLFRSYKALQRVYAEFPEMLSGAEHLLSQCSIEFVFGTEQAHHNLKNYSQSEEEDYALLQRLCEEGMEYRYPDADAEILARIDKEMEIIRQKGFLSYFLINWDITSYARSKGYFYVGRGSGANSVVAYLLRITDVDPIELDLYFERFINLYRKNPPDFDIDFSWTDREDVTRYIFERFENVSLLAAYNTFQYKAVVRELGKVFGLPKHEIDKLSAGKFRMEELDELSQLVLRYSALIQDFPNHLSIHAAGILISERPISCYTATFLPPKGYPTTHFDMVVAEDAGLYKFDILSQRGLAKIKDCLSIIRQKYPSHPPIDIHDMKRFKSDELIKDLLRSAKAIGCFYVESPAMRMLLRKLQVDNYLGLVAASSVIRPGVARSGMMREYILRYRFPERRQDAHPLLLEIMPETYGVMVYQEDVIKVAHYFAGLDLGEADSLRRGMSGKFRSREEFQHAREAFFSKAAEKGHAQELIAEIWRQVESFAGYAFAKGHSASYAVESYQSLFLKAYYPVEYMCATINNFGGFYRTELYVHEARMHGARVESPCVNRGSADTVIDGSSLILGMGLIKSIEFKCVDLLLQERFENGSFVSVTDFVKRVSVSLDQLCLLIRVGAFRFTGKEKKEMLWEAHFLLGHEKKSLPMKRLFDPPEKDYKLPTLFTADHEDAFDQIELLGFPLCDPFLLLKDNPPEHLMSTALEPLNDQVVTVVGYLVTVKHTSTANGKHMYFGTFIDRERNWLDSVHFPPVAEKHPFRGRGIYAMKGKVVNEFDCCSIEIEWMEKLAIIEDPRFSESTTMTRIRMNQKKQNTRTA